MTVLFILKRDNKKMTIKSSLPRISFQGAHGAYSDMACRAVYPDCVTVPCVHFEEVLTAVHDGKADLAMVPIDNLIAGRVADIHHLLPDSGLYIIGEHYQAIDHCLLGVKGAKIEDITQVHSHIHALPQCRDIIKELGLKRVVAPDTAISARSVAQWGDKTKASIASKLAAEIYDLDILKDNIQDYAANVTRFLIMSPESLIAPSDKGPTITSLVFKVRSIPAALYKALGGFASNGVNLTKLESYLVDGEMEAAQFYCEVDGHPDDVAMQHALEELGFFATHIKLLGTYPAHSFRASGS